jgi:ribosome-binding factor A
MDEPRGASRRSQRVASIIRQIVSETIVGELADPRIGLVTVTAVNLSADLRIADVNLSVLGDARQQQTCLEAVQHARGRLQERVSDGLKMKFCPLLRFHLDSSVKRSVSLSRLIAEARAEDEAARADRIRRGIEPPDPAGADSDP